MGSGEKSVALDLLKSSLLGRAFRQIPHKSHFFLWGRRDAYPTNLMKKNAIQEIYCLLYVKLMESLAPVGKSREFYLQRLHQRAYLYEFLTQPLVKPQIVIVLLEKQFAQSIRYPYLKSELVEAA